MVVCKVVSLFATGSDPVASQGSQDKFPATLQSLEEWSKGADQTLYNWFVSNRKVAVHMVGTMAVLARESFLTTRATHQIYTVVEHLQDDYSSVPVHVSSRSGYTLHHVRHRSLVYSKAWVC
jgi:hypothetical protein